VQDQRLAAPAALSARAANSPGIPRRHRSHGLQNPHGAQRGTLSGAARRRQHEHDTDGLHAPAG
jgi:hypothetical protein